MVTANTTKGVLEGGSPIALDKSNPLPLFIVQVFIIIFFSQALAWPLKKLHQPRVIAEVLVGIILGPSLMGRIPGFQATLFPKDSLPFISLAANFGLVLFLFLVGLELDPRMIRRSARNSIAVASAGMALPFGTGTAVSYGLYKLQNTPEIPFSTFLIFLGVAVSITAFPVLARILAELKLLKTSVGVTTMSAGLVDDCTAWVLLALVVALINASNGLVALYVFLLAIGWTLILVFVVGPLFRKLCIANGSLENGQATTLTMSILLVLVLVSAFVTDMIGIHAVFGGFLVGIIVPHEHGFAIYVTEKIEDLVNIILLPLYFVLSGLKTQIGLLNSPVVWGYVFLVIFIACFGKVVGCTLASRLWGLPWRESLTVGFLMNCKGLVELIVLNIGHDAGVINDQVFVIMIVMALVTTFMTTPIVMAIYPPKYQNSGNGALKSKDDSESGTFKVVESSSETRDSGVFKLAICLNLQHIPSLMTLVQLINPLASKSPQSKLSVHAFRLVELTQRTSAVMTMMAGDIDRDPVVNAFRAFCLLNSISSNSSVSIAPVEEFVLNVTEKVNKLKSDMVLLPVEGQASTHDSLNPFEHLLVPDRAGPEWSTQNVQFLLGVLRQAQSFTVGLFFDRGFGGLHEENGKTRDPTIVVAKDIADIGISHSDVAAPPYVGYHRVVVAFLGGPDDREALQFAFKLSRHSTVKLTVLRFTLPAGFEDKKSDTPAATETVVTEDKSQPLTPGSFYDGIYSVQSTVGHHQSGIEDVMKDENLLSRLLAESRANEAFGQAPVEVEQIETTQPLHSASEHTQKSLSSKDLIIVGRKPPSTLREELFSIFSESIAPKEAHPNRTTKDWSNTDMRKVFGDVAYSLISTGVKASLLVIQGKQERQ